LESKESSLVTITRALGNTTRLMLIVDSALHLATSKHSVRLNAPTSGLKRKIKITKDQFIMRTRVALKVQERKEPLWELSVSTRLRARLALAHTVKLM